MGVRGLRNNRGGQRRWSSVRLALLLLIACNSAPPAPAPTTDQWWADPDRACVRAGYDAELTSRHPSPDRRYEIVLCRIPRAIASPGQGSDAPGHLILVNTRTGMVAGEADLEMVQMMEDPEWERDRVRVGARAEWAL